MRLFVVVDERELSSANAKRVFENKAVSFFLTAKAAFRSDVIALRDAGPLRYKA